MNLTIFLFCFIITLAAASQEFTVIGGHNATEGEHPYGVAVHSCYADGVCRYMCGGVILSKDWILTTAYCTTTLLLGIRVIAGVTNLNDTAAQIITVKSYINHPHYNSVNELSDYNIGLMKLSTPLELNDQVQPAKLPEQDGEASGIATLSGWGATGYDEDGTYIFPVDMQTVDVPIIDFEECWDILTEQINSERLPVYNNSVVCTGLLTGDSGVCFLDGGEPLTQNGTVIGIVSWLSLGCGEERTISVYTKVSSFINWIAETVGDDLTLSNI